MVSFYKLMGVPPTGFDPDHSFQTSWILPPAVMGGLRLLFSIYGFTSIFFQFGWYGTHNNAEGIGRSFSFFTNLTYWGISFYTLIAGIHSLVYAFKGHAWLDRWPRPLQALHSFYYTTIVTLPFLVTIVFWAILYQDPWFTQTFSAWSNISFHGLNSLVALLEILLPATHTPPFLHVLFIVLVLALYLALAYVTYYAQGWYTYSFLDPNNGAGHVAAYVFGIAAGGIVMFLIVWVMIWLRRKMTRGKVKRSPRDHSGNFTNTQSGYGAAAIADSGPYRGYHQESNDVEMRHGGPFKHESDRTF